MVIVVSNTLTTLVSDHHPRMTINKLLIMLSEMNLSHVITDFSFGPYFPDMTQPLKNTFELTYDRKSGNYTYLHGDSE